MKYLAMAGVLNTLVWVSCSAADPTLTPPYHLPQPDDAPGRLLALVEIPAGSFIKYELDKAKGHVVVDRFLTTPVVYPANARFLRRRVHYRASDGHT